MSAYIYILANKRNGTPYTGVTIGVGRRIYEHQQGLVEGFSKRYNTKLLVYFEQHDRITDSLAREQAIKHWLRRWKIELIEASNPDWKDLIDQIPL